ncbi:BED zinc finger family protein [Candida parapsilosis]|uniref:BED-type domain-containing protein n=2 Tax=Candida parapsilosis TaxID=5480 RepID=G8BCU6_CANPC|nr:uncharacterized protein CPAR2_207340 [Candida parapsilosis]KAF6054759.1 BED zinc finger family protein [Candida parapsilosis]KAF6056215.1 BED zinc finger family protein [Candida parapsilosis]KAF6059148.1 BED zinc finger family protein [Candida parapsilosis]KAF6067905.1 BED zinc finger family protein [Candida parapsilosis]KAI5903633.1 hypothetical protein K4G60_g2788 [Candida parapsilosis]
MNPSDTSRNLHNYPNIDNSNVNSRWEQQQSDVHDEDNSMQLPLFHMTPLDNPEGLLPTLESTEPILVPTNLSTSSMPGHNLEAQIQPTPQLPSQSYQEVVPVSNDSRSFQVPTSSQLNQHLAISDLNKRRRSSTHSSSKPKHTRRNRPGKRFGAKKRCWVWSWFKQDDKNPNIAVCNTCLRAIVRVPSDKGSPKKLIEHLKTHGITAGRRTDERNASRNRYQQHTENISARQSSLERNEQFGQRQAPPIRHNMPHNESQGYQMPQAQTYPFQIKLFHHHLLSFLIENRLPINIIRSRPFHQVVHDLKPDAISDLSELLYLYDSILHVSRYGPNTRLFPSAEEDATIALLANTLQRQT